MAAMALMPTSAASYAMRSAATAAVGAACLWIAARGASESERQSWRAGTRFFDVCLATAAGLAVCALWVLPECSELYRIWCVLPLGADGTAAAGGVVEASPYDPHVCGWPLTVAKIVGSAFVIAPAEEVFFRHFLYKRLVRRDFWNVPLRHFDASAFCWMVLLFTLEHDRPLAAAAAGAAYGLLAIWRGLPAAIVAHVVTNLALGLHVVAHDAWRFW